MAARKMGNHAGLPLQFVTILPIILFVSALRILYCIFGLFVKPVEKISHIRYPVGQNLKDTLATEVTEAKEGFKFKKPREKANA